MFDGKDNKYKLGVTLTPDDKVKCQFCNKLVYEAKDKADKPPVWYKPHRYVTRLAVGGSFPFRQGSGHISPRSASPSPRNTPSKVCYEPVIPPHASHLQQESGVASYLQASPGHEVAGQSEGGVSVPGVENQQVQN